MTVDINKIKRAMAEADCLATAQQVDAAFDRLAAAITAELADSAPLVYTVMNGGLVVAGKRLARLHFPLEVGYLHASRYGMQLQGNSLLDWRVRPAQEIKGRTILVIDDILDEGHTLKAICQHLIEEGAGRVLPAVPVHKDLSRARVGLAA